MRNINRKLLLCVAAATILQPLSSQAKQKIISPKNTVAAKALQSIEPSYLLQITVAENDCEKTLGENCFFRDKLFSEPYLHETKLTIFLNKIFATQHFKDKTITTQVKDGNHSLLTDNNNLISFNTKNGLISDLKLVKGDLNKESVNISKCSKSEILYNFYQTYNKDAAILTKSGLYRDEYNFNGLNEYILFSEETNRSEIMAIIKDSAQKITAIQNIRLCKTKSSDDLNVRHLSIDECSGDNQTTEECFKYSECEDLIAVDDCEVTLFKDGFN